VLQGIDKITLTFNGSVDPTTLSKPGAVALTGPNGPVTITSITALAPPPPQPGQPPPPPSSVFQINFAGQTSGGIYTLALSPSLVTDFSGNQMNQNGNSTNGEPGVPPGGDGFQLHFIVLPVNAQGFHVDSAVADSLATPPGMSSITLTFTKGVDPSTFHSSDVTLTGPGGTVSQASISVTPSNSPSNTVWVIGFPTQTAAGTYTLTLSNTIKDQNGNFIDQNLDDPGPYPGGPNTQQPEDRYTTQFTLTAQSPGPGPGPGPGPSPGPGPITGEIPIGQGQLSVLVGPVRKRNGKYTQRIQLFNTSSQPFSAPLGLIFTQLTRGVKLKNRTGFTRVIAPGSPYKFVFPPAGQLGSFAGVAVDVQFKNPKAKRINYKLRVVAGLFPGQF